MAKQKVALECLSYHATASIDDTIKLAQDQIPSAETYNLYRYLICWLFFFKKLIYSTKQNTTVNMIDSYIFHASIPLQFSIFILDSEHCVCFEIIRFLCIWLKTCFWNLKNKTLKMDFDRKLELAGTL